MNLEQRAVHGPSSEGQTGDHVNQRNQPDRAVEWHGIAQYEKGEQQGTDGKNHFGKRVGQKGTEHSDEMVPEGFLTNNAGGILGGISTGQDIVVNVAVKPTSSIRLKRRTIDKEGNATTIETHGRHDPCVGIRATPICEAMLALTLMDHYLRHRAQNADVRSAVPVLGLKQKP